METEEIEYQCGDTLCQGYFTYHLQEEGRRPVVLVAHTWKGQDAFARQKAQELAELGYAGFAVDLYGNGQTADTPDEALKLMTPLFLDRELLRKRIYAAYQAIKGHDLVDPNRIGAIGFCFGGLTVIELVCSGAQVRGAVSFHGTLGTTLGEQQATPAPLAESIKGGLLILHGHDDPLVSQEDIQKMQTDLTEAKVDWQMHIYGHAAHAFTNPKADDPEAGMVYNAKATERSWITMRNYFQEVFTTTYED